MVESCAAWVLRCALNARLIHLARSPDSALTTAATQAGCVTRVNGEKPTGYMLHQPKDLGWHGWRAGDSRSALRVFRQSEGQAHAPAPPGAWA